MTKLKRRQKNIPEPGPKRDRPYPLPGEAGVEIIQLILQDKQDEALDLLYETYIGTPGELVDIQILEDDGETLFFVADRGPFKVYGIGRILIMNMKAGVERVLREQEEEITADSSEASNKPGEPESPKPSP